MGLKVFVVARDRDLRHLLENILHDQGCTTQAFPSPDFCPLFSADSPACRHPNRCCEALLIDYEAAWVTGLDLIEEQLQKNCKVPASNKAFFTIAPDYRMLSRSRDIGCQMIPKPFRLKMLKDWLAACEERQKNPGEETEGLRH